MKLSKVLQALMNIKTEVQASELKLQRVLKTVQPYESLKFMLSPVSSVASAQSESKRGRQISEGCKHNPCSYESRAFLRDGYSCSAFSHSKVRVRDDSQGSLLSSSSVCLSCRHL